MPKTNIMKLYTEEQVSKIIFETKQWSNLSEDWLMASVTPIELPDNDEDAGKIALYISSVRDEEKAVFIIAGAMKYNEWIRSKILNQNK